MSRLDRAPLIIKMAVLTLPLVAVGVIASSRGTAIYQRLNKSAVQQVVVTNTHSDPTAVLGDTTYYPPGYVPTDCPAPYTGTPPNCQLPPGSSPPPGFPTTCPAPPTGTPPNCQPPASPSGPPSSQPPAQPSNDACRTPYPGTSPPSWCQPTPGQPNPTPSNGAPNNYSAPGSPGGPTYSPPAGAPTFSVNDPASCLGSVLGADAAARFRSGSFTPSPDQIAKVSNSGCFSARVSSGPPTGQPNSPTERPGAFSSIPVAPPPQFQSDSPAMACAKQILGSTFGSQPTQAQMAEVQSKCFSLASSGSQIGFIDPSGHGPGGSQLPGVALGSNSEGKPGNLPTLPAEVKACVIKAGITEADISAIQHGQPPTAQQKQLGEGCFSKYAKDKGYTPPMLTPPDPSQPFDLNSKQNQCADLVAQTHGLKFNQISPAIVSTWSADDVGKLRSCYGVAAASAASANSLVFTPTSPEVAVSSTKLTCIRDAVGKDKLAALLAGTTTMNESDRKAVYNKCINPTKIAAGANPALLGVLAAMPPSDLESQFIPVDGKSLPAPSANSPDKSTKSTEIAIGGEVNVAPGSGLPTKVDVFVKSSSQIFTVALKKVSDTKASWTLNVGQNKLAVGDHKAYTVATLADASQLRSPDATFAIGAAVAAAKSNSKVVEAAAVAVAVLIGVGLAWKWHKRHPKAPANP